MCEVVSSPASSRVKTLAMISPSLNEPSLSWAAIIPSRRFSGDSRSSGRLAMRLLASDMKPAIALLTSANERSSARSAGSLTQRQ